MPENECNTLFTNKNLESDIDDLLFNPRLPFSFYQGPNKSFHSPFQIRLVPNVKLHVNIIDVIFEHSQNLDPFIYVIELQYGIYKWIVKKGHEDFTQLHHRILLFRAALHINTFTERFREFRKKFKTSSIPKVPNLPGQKYFNTNEIDFGYRKQQMENYLKEIISIEGYQLYHYTLEFFEIGPFSFIDGLGDKHKEGYVHCNSYGYNSIIYYNSCMKCCAKYGSMWQKRWLMLKDSFVAAIDPSNGSLKYVLLFDRSISILMGKADTGFEDGLILSNYLRRFEIRCKTPLQAREWVDDLQKVLDTNGSSYIAKNTNSSFVPVRPNTECKWIIDGACYFEAVAEALEKAKEEIFITGWWLTPEIYMKRPVTHGHYWQLSYILQRKAKEGVKIYILIYKEVKFALGINSAYTLNFLRRLHKENIKILRHPTAKLSFWAHHEKIVCIDQTYAFFGGLDLCYGRWDDYQHRLTDLGETADRITVHRHFAKYSYLLPYLKSKIYYPKNSSCGLTKKYSSAPQLVNNTDVVDQSKLKHKGLKFKGVADGLIAITKLKKCLNEVDETFNDIPKLPTQADINRTIQNYCIIHLGMEKKYHLWYGKDYTNFIVRDIIELNKPYTDLIDRNAVPRLPWHDVGIFVQGKAAQDISRHFIQRWNYTKTKLQNSNNKFPLLLPKCVVNEFSPSILALEMGCTFRADCQVLRSASLWSVGIGTTEHSIANAYVNTIKIAEHYIYIENQFFISQPSNQGDVYNEISDALYERIMRAYREKKTFRVYILLPLLPAFEGDIAAGSGTAIFTISHWNYKSTCRGSTSLFERLKKTIEDPSDYLYFYGLRKHGTLNDRLVTELIYIHCKIMIVDDLYAIIGSANLNDRSLLGCRDSEIAAKIRDSSFENSTMDGQPYTAGKFCLSLRKALFSEHLGICQTGEYLDIDDPVATHFFKNTWHKIAKKNTEIYEEVFRCLPTDAVTSFDGLKHYESGHSLSCTNLKLASQKLQEIRGHLVLMPFKFLCEENLSPSILVKEGYLPNSLWV